MLNSLMILYPDRCVSIASFFPAKFARNKNATFFSWVERGQGFRGTVSWTSSDLTPWIPMVYRLEISRYISFNSFDLYVIRLWWISGGCRFTGGWLSLQVREHHSQLVLFAAASGATQEASGRWRALHWKVSHSMWHSNHTDWGNIIIFSPTMTALLRHFTG